MLKEYEDKVELKQPSVDWLRDLLGRLDFEVIPQQNCTEIYFVGDRYSGNIKTTLDTIAPCVKDGSYFEFEGEGGSIWRWVLKNGKYHEITPQIIWPDV